MCMYIYVCPNTVYVHLLQKVLKQNRSLKQKNVSSLLTYHSCFKLKAYMFPSVDTCQHCVKLHLKDTKSLVILHLSFSPSPSVTFTITPCFHTHTYIQCKLTYNLVLILNFHSFFFILSFILVQKFIDNQEYEFILSLECAWRYYIKLTACKLFECAAG